MVLCDGGIVPILRLVAQHTESLCQAFCLSKDKLFCFEDKSVEIAIA